MGALMFSGVVSARAQVFDTTIWGTDGNVDAVVRQGNRLYVGGAFTSAGPVTGGGVVVDRITGVELPPYPRVAGTVRTVVADGVGGWFIGGLFNAVGGEERMNLAHVLADGSVAPWTPDPDGEVLTLALAGTTLYVGGSFGHVGTVARLNVAAVNTASGAVTNWAPDADQSVRCLLVQKELVYAGGDFAVIGDSSRSRVAALGSTDGLATNWNPDVEVGLCTVMALAATGDTIYLGGLFSSVGGVPREHLAAVSATSGQPMTWHPAVTGPSDMSYGDPYVACLAVRGSSIYVGGHFTGIGTVVRGGLAELDRGSGAVTSWDPAPGPGPRDVAGLVLRDTTAIVSGYFETIGGLVRRFAAEVRISDGLCTSWDPNLNDAAFSAACNGSAVYLGGSFTGLGTRWKPRSGLAAFDATNGSLLDWDPHPDGLIVTALAYARGLLYVGGYFSMIGGQPRFGLASVDTATGLASSWDPSANSVVGSLLVVGDTLYAGGYFTTMGGTPRSRLASFDLVSGAMTAWDPNASSDVYCLAQQADRIIVGGFFRTIGGTPRNHLASVDRVTGAVTPWDPNADGWVNALALVGDTLFTAGRFGTIGGQPRHNLAAVSASTGRTMNWVMDANAEVTSLAVVEDTLVMGGIFSTLAGSTRNHLGAAGMSADSLLHWSPVLDGGVLCLSSFGETVFVGGSFQVAGTSPASGLAAVSFAPPVPGPGPSIAGPSLAWIAPNPVQGDAVVRISLPSATRTELTVFDVQGRRVAVLLDNVAVTAGEHDLSLDLRNLRVGAYVLRLRAGGIAASKKFIVLR